MCGVGSLYAPALLLAPPVMPVVGLFVGGAALLGYLGLREVSKFLDEKSGELRASNPWQSTACKVLSVMMKIAKTALIPIVIAATGFVFVGTTILAYGFSYGIAITAWGVSVASLLCFHSVRTRDIKVSTKVAEN